MTKNAVRITAMIDRIIDVVLYISHFTCRPYLVLDQKKFNHVAFDIFMGKGNCWNLAAQKLT